VTLNSLRFSDLGSHLLLAVWLDGNSVVHIDNKVALY